MNFNQKNISNLNRSFARRIGKTLSNTQKNALKKFLPCYQFNHLHIYNRNVHYGRYELEIGYGMGKHFIDRAIKNPDAMHIGADPYLNGVANVITLAKMHKLNNIMIWPDDVDMIFLNIPDNLLNSVYVLFPDPWPKNKHLKRRIINNERINIILSKLSSRGRIYFVTDIYDYFTHTLNLLAQFKNIISITNLNINPYENYVPTKYHEKAIKNNREVRFLYATKYI